MSFPTTSSTIRRTVLWEPPDDRIVSTSGDWSGNVFDFVIEALRRMQQGLKIPFVLKGNQRVDDTPIHKLLREAITNACVHADFYGRQGLVIQKSEQGYRLSNPGTVRISIPDAIEGGISDPRNGIMLKIFSLIEFGERAGSGLSGICKRWEKVYHTPVTIEETHKDGVDRTVLTLSTGGNEQDVEAMLELYSDLIDAPEPQTDLKITQVDPKSDQKSTQKIANEIQSDQKTAQKTSVSDLITARSNQKSDQKTISTTKKVVEKLLTAPHITISQLATDLVMSPSGIKKILKTLKESGHIQRVGPDKGGHWEVLIND